MKLAKLGSSPSKAALCKQARNILASALICLYFALPVSLSAQDRDDASVELELALVSNYVWRGENLFDENLSNREKETALGKASAPAFQPSITFYPGENLYFNIWSSFAITARSDKDLDESGVIGEDERNSLRRLDEIDYAMGYEKESRIGIVGFGIVTYSYPYHRNKEISTTEIFFNYSPGDLLSNVPYTADALSNLYLNIYSGLREFNDYYQIGYSQDFSIIRDIELSFDIAAGYQITSDGQEEHISAWKDLTASVIANIYGVDIGLNVAQRIHPDFYDGDEEKDFETEDGEKIQQSLFWLYFGYTLEF